MNYPFERWFMIYIIGRSDKYRGLLGEKIVILLLPTYSIHHTVKYMIPYI